MIFKKTLTIDHSKSSSKYFVFFLLTNSNPVCLFYTHIWGGKVVLLYSSQTSCFLSLFCNVRFVCIVWLCSCTLCVSLLSAISFFRFIVLTFDPAPKNAIPRWCTGRKWHIPMASNRKRSRGRIKAYNMGQGEGPTVPVQTDAPEESDLWTAWQLFPLDDD